MFDLLSVSNIFCFVVGFAATAESGFWVTVDQFSLTYLPCLKVKKELLKNESIIVPPVQHETKFTVDSSTVTI